MKGSTWLCGIFLISSCESAAFFAYWGSYADVFAFVHVRLEFSSLGQSVTCYILGVVFGRTYKDSCDDCPISGASVQHCFESTSMRCSLQLLNVTSCYLIAFDFLVSRNPKHCHMVLPA